MAQEERQKKRQAILSALAKATEDEESLPGDGGCSNGAAGQYYTLTHQEMEALIEGDVETIEDWVSKLDKRHATWLLSHLIKEIQ